MSLHINGKLLGSPANVRLGRKRLTVTNTIAYCNMELNYWHKKLYCKGTNCVAWNIKKFEATAEHRVEKSKSID